MHNAALAALGLAAEGWRYQRLPIPAALFEVTVRALPRAGFVGINVTIPHKEAAFALSDEATDTARAIGAANTLTFDERTHAIRADNTDVEGLLASLPPDQDPRVGSALILGAGGAARAALGALLQAGAQDVAVHNRTQARAERMVRELGGGRVVERPVPADLIINATSVGLGGVKALPVAADVVTVGSCVVDMVYSETETALLTFARERGARTVDGLEVLVAQGAASLERWTGRPAPRETMRRAARSANST